MPVIQQESNEGDLGSQNIRYADHGRAKKELAGLHNFLRKKLYRQVKLTYVYVTNIHWFNTTYLYTYFLFLCCLK